MNLKSQAKLLKPVVNIGKNGLTDGLLEQIQHELKTKRLIKLKILKSAASTREERAVVIAELVEKTSAELIDSIGAVVVLHK